MFIKKYYLPKCLTITGEYFESSITVCLEGPNLTDEEYYDLEIFCSEHTFEEFIEIFPEQFSHTLDIPVDDIYEEYIYLRNSRFERLNWNDLLTNEEA